MDRHGDPEPLWVFTFGYETPYGIASSFVGSWNDPCSAQVAIRAADAAQAMRLGQAFANRYLAALFEGSAALPTISNFPHHVQLLAEAKRVRCVYAWTDDPDAIREFVRFEHSEDWPFRPLRPMRRWPWQRRRWPWLA